MAFPEDWGRNVWNDSNLSQTEATPAHLSLPHTPTYKIRGNYGVELESALRKIPPRDLIHAANLQKRCSHKPRETETDFLCVFA